MGQRWRGKAPKAKAPCAAACEQPEPAPRLKATARYPAGGMIRDKRQIDMHGVWVIPEEGPLPCEATTPSGELVTLARAIVRERKSLSSTPALRDKTS